jgi:hypothetical protein
MFTIEVKSTGLSERELGDSIFKAASEKVRAKLQNVTCPEHGNYIHAKLVPNPGGMKIEFVEPCCQKLIDAAGAALK